MPSRYQSVVEEKPPLCPEKALVERPTFGDDGRCLQVYSCLVCWSSVVGAASYWKATDWVTDTKNRWNRFRVELFKMDELQLRLEISAGFIGSLRLRLIAKDNPEHGLFSSISHPHHLRTSGLLIFSWLQAWLISPASWAGLISRGSFKSSSWSPMMSQNIVSSPRGHIVPDVLVN